MANGEGQDPEDQATSPADGQGDDTQEASQTPTQAQASQDGGQAQAQSGATDPETGGQTGFTHPMLRGRDPQEIDQLMAQMEQTVREQGQRLNEMSQQQAQQQQEPQEPQAPDISDEEFYDRPVEAVRQVVGHELQRTVEPLAREIQGMTRQSQANTKREEYRSKYPKWDQYEDHMRMLAQRKGLDFEQQVLPDEGIVEVLYYAIEGLQSQQGQQAQQAQPQQGQQMTQQQNQGQQSPAQGRQPAPPQHPPSSSPRPSTGSQNSDSGPSRDLTENERRLAREYGMSPQEFIRWQEMDSREAVHGERPGQEG